MSQLEVGAIVVSALSAFLFGLASALQQRVVIRETDASVGFIQAGTNVLRAGSWIVGAICAALGFALQALGLSWASLSIVQPILLSGVAWALVARRVLAREFLSRSEFLLSLAIVVVLAVVLALLNAQDGTAVPQTRTWLMAAAGSGLLIALCAVAIWLGSPKIKGIFGGTISGFLFALLAVFVKELSNLYQHDGFHALMGWQMIAFVVVGVAALSSSQWVFALGPLSWTLPALSVVDPLLSVVLGWYLYGDVLHVGTWRLVVEVLGIVSLVFVVARIALAEDSSE